jgi:hypothetical protein
MLFDYCGADDQRRATKLTVPVRVRAGLRVSAALQEAPQSLGTHVLALDAENLGSGAYQPIAWVLLAPAWRAAALALAPPAPLPPRSTARSYLELAPLPGRLPHAHHQLSLWQSALPLLADGSTSPPFLDLLFRAKHAALTEACRPKAPLLSAGDLEVVLVWRTGDGAHFGHSYASGLTLPPGGCAPSPFDSYPPLSSPAPICCALAVPARLRHSFQRGGACTLPVELTVRSAAARPIQVVFEALRSPGPGQPRPPAPWVWVGATRSSVTELAPGGTARFALQASFTAPGVFNMNRTHSLVHGGG